MISIVFKCEGCGVRVTTYRIWNYRTIPPSLDVRDLCDACKEKPVMTTKPSLDPLLQFFAYDHLPPHLRNVSKPFCELAVDIVQRLPRNPERTVALRKLLEAKDCAVRSVLWKDPA